MAGRDDFLWWSAPVLSQGNPENFQPNTQVELPDDNPHYPG